MEKIISSEKVSVFNSIHTVRVAEEHNRSLLIDFPDAMTVEDGDNGSVFGSDEGVSETDLIGEDVEDFPADGVPRDLLWDYALETDRNDSYSHNNADDRKESRDTSLAAGSQVEPNVDGLSPIESPKDNNDIDLKSHEVESPIGWNEDLDNNFSGAIKFTKGNNNSLSPVDQLGDPNNKKILDELGFTK